MTSYTNTCPSMGIQIIFNIRNEPDLRVKLEEDEKQLKSSCKLSF